MAELLDRVRAIRRRLGVAGPTTLRGEGDFERVALPTPDADVLRDVLIAERAERVLEVGLAYGASALAVAEALLVRRSPTSRHLIVDAYQERFGDAGWNAIVSAGLADRCSLVRERSQLALPRLVGEGTVVDAAFVDGSHLFHNVFVDLFFVRELVRPGGVVILDDCGWPSVATAARYFEANAGWRARPIAGPTRLRAFRMPDPPFEPRFEDFVPFGAPPDG